MPDRIWTASNFLSFFRALLAVPTSYCIVTEFPGNRLWAAGFITIAVASDFLDGYLARQLHQVSEFGKILDPLADKIAAGVVSAVLVWAGETPPWFFAAIVGRDLLIVLGGVYIRNKKKIVVQSNWPGKIAVSAIALYIFLSTLRVESLEVVRSWVMWFSVAMMVLSLLLYTQRLFIGRNIETTG